MSKSASIAIWPAATFFYDSKTRPRVPFAAAIAAALALLLMGASAQAAATAFPGAAQPPVWLHALLAQTGDEVAEAMAEAEAIIRAANEEAARIHSEALKNAAQIEADATRKAAEIEAEAIRNAARASAQRAGAAPAGRAGSVDVPRERYRNLTGIWSWKGNARNRKFELKQEDDGSVKTKLFTSPRTRFYREDLRYNDGVLSGRTFQTVKTLTGNDERRFRDFQLSISRDGESLVGTIIDSTNLNNRERRLDVVWNRVRD